MAFNVKNYAKKLKGGAQKDKAQQPWPMPGNPSGAKKNIVKKLKGMKAKKPKLR